MPTKYGTIKKNRSSGESTRIKTSVADTECYKANMLELKMYNMENLKNCSTVYFIKWELNKAIFLIYTISPTKKRF